MSACPFEITPDALAQMKRLVARKAVEGQFLRVGVKGGGCSGFEYVIKLDTRRTAFDMEFDFEGLTVITDSKSAPFIQGATITYTGNLMHGGFQFENPNATRSCGCGSSFTPKPKE